jgi:hypothetical protein
VALRKAHSQPGGGDQRVIAAGARWQKDHPAIKIGLMLPDIDIWRAALVMVKRYGEDAMLEAAERADQLLDEGDMAGAETWHRILNAIERLQAKAPAEGEKVHQERPTNGRFPRRPSGKEAGAPAQVYHSMPATQH